MSFELVITTAGFAAIAALTGTDAVTITQVGVSAASITPTPSATALTGEIKRLTTFGGTAPDSHTMSLQILDNTSDTYSLKSFALYLSDGTLFALYGQSTAILEKTAATILLLETDIALGAIDSASITFGDTNFVNPPASETVNGVAKLATNAQALAGINAFNIMTPARVNDVINNLHLSLPALEAQKGVAELATEAQALAGINNYNIMTPFRVAQAITQSVNSLATSLPASTSASGVVELATTAETVTGTDTTRAVTPAGVKAAIDNIPGVAHATSATAGIVELATTTESVTGTDTTRAVTPAGLKSAIDSIPSVSNASTTTAGIVELATTTEAVTGTDTTRAVTPAGLKSAIDNIPTVPTASDSISGTVELATTTEAVAGTDTTRAVTPAGLKSAIDNIPSIPNASATTAGIVELATDAETLTGTDAARAVTPAGLKNKILALISNIIDINLSQNGHIVLFGLVVNWGETASLAVNTSEIVTFSKAFPTACFVCIPVVYATSANDDCAPLLLSKSQTQAELARGFETGVNTSGKMAYIALGH